MSQVSQRGAMRHVIGKKVCRPAISGQYIAEEGKREQGATAGLWPRRPFRQRAQRMQPGPLTHIPIFPMLAHTRYFPFVMINMVSIPL